jgi:inner membrane protein
MSPLTHFIASWIIAAKTTDNPRDCRLVTLAGLAPDLDGLGIVADMVMNAVNHTGTFTYYQTYHHYWLHGIAGALVVAALCAAAARHRWQVFVFALATFHLHVFCDLVGSRGPDPGDLWPIHYFGPFSQWPMWLWRGQWRLDGWQNQIISLALLVWSLRFAITRGTSFVGVLSQRADATFVTTLRKWSGVQPVNREANNP